MFLSFPVGSCVDSVLLGSTRLWQFPCVFAFYYRKPDRIRFASSIFSTEAYSYYSYSLNLGLILWVIKDFFRMWYSIIVSSTLAKDNYY